ncbi:Asp23/Gls24 family envelope stress response protein [Amycolatopsis sp., V23-08]|uniref:Asp23/Gls24 family envelope stress response protein n=1 Tax=Amycolatopsis heterodermiae TaxID=3110235 RepID=A0ABU5RL84_9PSEU|nr:Asp23/Gls24 family envelope stress response protein [Amycolatopsis sp., V23-08]MEA5367048.1 Asp23/Gls24 family envelope stress response protein [Amycolatopsis sp., V23-08]
MSDVINSIFGRANSGTTTPGGYAAPHAETGSETVDTAVAPEIVDTEAIEESPADTVEPAEDAVETDDTETAEAETTDDEAEADEDLEDEAVTEESDEDADSVETDEDSDAVEAESAEAEDEATEDTDTVDSEDDSDDTSEVAEEASTEENPVEAAAEADVVDEAERVVAAAARPAAGTRGATTIGDDVVVKIVARVARKAEGVHEIAADGVEVAVDGDVATITISLVIEFGHAVKALGEQIRTDVIEAVEQFLGLDVEGVDVHVADIHFPDAD